MLIVLDTTIKGVHLSAYSQESEVVNLLWQGGSYINGKSSQSLTSLFSSMLQCTGNSVEDIQRFFISSGPGSFTGIKLGISFLQGLVSGREVNVTPYCGPIEFLRRMEDSFDLLLPITKTNGFLFRKVKDQLNMAELNFSSELPQLISKDLNHINQFFEIQPLAKLNGWSERVAVVEGWPIAEDYLSTHKLEYESLTRKNYIERAGHGAVLNQNLINLAQGLNAFEPFYLKKSAPEERAESDIGGSV